MMDSVWNSGWNAFGTNLFGANSANNGGGFTAPGWGVTAGSSNASGGSFPDNVLFPSSDWSGDLSGQGASIWNAGTGNGFGLDSEWNSLMGLFNGLGYGDNNNLPAAGWEQPSDSGTPTPSPANGSDSRTNGSPVKTVLIEKDAVDSEHAQSVQSVYNQYNPDGRNSVQIVDFDHGNAVSQSTQAGVASQSAQSENDIDALIDDDSTSMLNTMDDRLQDVMAQGDTQVVNASLGYSRNSIYKDVVSALQDDPTQASQLGLQQSDITSLDTDKDGQLLVSSKVADAVQAYVDNRMDASNSAFKQALGTYQETTHEAAQQGISVVVASGNFRDLNQVFTPTQLGTDTNFLAMSDDVISVGAVDTQGTQDPSDDQVADFSSWGTGRYQPTVVADGVNVETPFGLQDGTSFSAPAVAGTIARMKAANPDLNVGEIKQILQSTATDLTPQSTLADGAGVLNEDLAVSQASALA